MTPAARQAVRDEIAHAEMGTGRLFTPIVTPPTVPTVRPFVPTDIAGCETWLAADKIVGKNDNDAISTWSDSSGQAKDGTEATGANQPLYKTAIVNGLPVVRFDGVNDNLGVAGITNNDATRTLVVVAKRSAVGALNGIVGFSSSNAVIGGNNAGQWIYNTNQAGGGQNLGSDTGGFAVLAVRFNSVSSADGFLNNGSATNFDPNDTYQAGGSILRLGNVNGTFFFAGDLPEMVLYSTALSGANFDILRNYLGNKYNLGFGSAQTTTVPSETFLSSGTAAYGWNKKTYNFNEAYLDGGVLTKDWDLAAVLRNTGLFTETVF